MNMKKIWEGSTVYRYMGLEEPAKQFAHSETLANVQSENEAFNKTMTVDTLRKAVESELQGTWFHRDGRFAAGLNLLEY